MTATFPVDLHNPGQVFACLGFVEAAEVLLGEAKGGFDWSGSDGARFCLASSGNEDPVGRVLRFLDKATVKLVVPADSDNSTKQWKVGTTRSIQPRRFPFPEPSSPATLPARLEDDTGQVVEIDYWGDATRRDNVKFWAGASGYSGAELVRDALGLIRDRVTDCVDDPFALAARQTSSFRFDWRRDYVPIDAGFSPNKHNNRIVMQGYPVVELMAAIGMTYARPLRHDKLEYTYAVAGTITDLYPLVFLRAALGAQQPLFPGMPLRRFRMKLDWPGQENQARCITNVIEEPMT